MNFKDGDEITVNGKPCRIEGGILVPVVSKGPLGGELKRIGDLGHRGMSQMVGVFGCAADLAEFLPGDYLVETNIPPRPTFTPMSAGEAAKLPDIVGRWVAVKVDSAEPAFSSTMLTIGYGGPLGEFFRHNTPILLIEGVDLP